MAYLLSSERSSSAAAPATLFTVFATWLQKTVDLRAKRHATRVLLQMDEARLHDLGLSRQDIVEALRGGPSLNTRRADRARAFSASR